ncbi:Protein of unknown function [Pyronema omphalodes CBS 100304]|uniref:Uncharacterized protein n=1 Tax=Pyronema omphalodes (strain CBS 100304) TaxID=1076935 RepID=U4LW77_PYROM|nr:Protein of unknown function [Pyronema omphalodes CBS 100304]
MGSVVPGFALRMVPNPGYKLRYGRFSPTIPWKRQAFVWLQRMTWYPGLHTSLLISYRTPPNLGYRVEP